MRARWTDGGRHGTAIGAGVGAAIFFAFAPLPLQVAVAADMGLSSQEASRWILAVWGSGAVASIVLSLRHRQPIAITWSVLGLAYLGSVAHSHSFAELVGANLVAAVAILVLAALGVGERVMGLVPLPLVLAMFAGSVLQYVTGGAAAAAADAPVAGVAVLAYLVARGLGVWRVPPVGVAALAGIAAALVAGRVGPVEGAWSAPSVAPPEMAFSLDAVLTVSPPLVVFALALGNVQGLGHLAAQGYRVPANAVSIGVGIASIANALMGGHQASVGRATSAMLAGPEAGPAESRHVASVVAAGGGLAIAVGATTIVAVVGALPATLVAAVTGLAVLGVFQDALERSLGGDLRTGALVAFVVAASPFEALGVGAASWALVAGIAASLLLERPALAQAVGASAPASGRMPVAQAISWARARRAAASVASPDAAPVSSAAARSQALQAVSGR